MGISEWWKQRRRLRVDDASKQTLGVDPKTQGGADAIAAQQFNVGVFVRQCFDAGYEPITLIQTLLVGAVWLADNVGVSREQLAKVVYAVELKSDRQLIWMPPGSGS